VQLSIWNQRIERFVRHRFSRKEIPGASPESSAQFMRYTKFENMARAPIQRQRHIPEKRVTEHHRVQLPPIRAPGSRDLAFAIPKSNSRFNAVRFSAREAKAA
jgi:hypothetical protein